MLTNLFHFAEGRTASEKFYAYGENFFVRSRIVRSIFFKSFIR